MSIINDALKKAEREKNKIVIDEPKYTNIASQYYNSKPNINIEPLPASAKKSTDLMGFLALILVVMAIISSSIIIINLNKKTDKPVSADKLNIPVTITPPKEIMPTTSEPRLLKNASNPPSLTLSGTVIGENEPLAIIDDNIVKKGDVVSGAKVREIYSDSVVLEYNGAEFSIRTP